MHPPRTLWLTLILFSMLTEAFWAAGASDQECSISLIAFRLMTTIKSEYVNASRICKRQSFKLLSQIKWIFFAPLCERRLFDWKGRERSANFEWGSLSMGVKRSSPHSCSQYERSGGLMKAHSREQTRAHVSLNCSSFLPSQVSSDIAVLLRFLSSTLEHDRWWFVWG